MIKVKKISLAPADINALFATPLIILPAPASGKVNNILGISQDMTFNSVAYAGGSTFLYYVINTGSSIFLDSQFLPGLSSRNAPALKAWDATQTIFSTVRDFYLTTDAATSLGNSNIDFYIVYEEKDLV